jgi:hypothetical protein
MEEVSSGVKGRVPEPMATAAEHATSALRCGQGGFTAGTAASTFSGMALIYGNAHMDFNNKIDKERKIHAFPQIDITGR